jgi:type IV pilus assembly protein PilN
MIRINLVAGERKAVKASGGGGFQLAQKVTAIGILLLVLTTLFVGWRYFALSQEKGQLTRNIEAERREEARLADVLKQVAEFEASSAQSAARIALIKELSQGKDAPVHMVDQLSRALPEMTWLTSVKQDGFDVTIEGRCLSLNTLSDFVGNLEASRYFKRPVEIIETAVMPPAQEGPNLIRFVVKGTFQMAGIEPAPVGKTGRGGN